VAGSVWNDDDPADATTIARNAAHLLSSLADTAHERAFPDAADACGWHRALYAGCAVPVAEYVGRCRGDAAVPELVGYEVGVGPLQADRLPERVGVWSIDVDDQVAAIIAGVHAAVDRLDAKLVVGVRPQTVDELHAVVQLVAVVHGEWIRIHPFANGNGRTARIWAALLAMRYGLAPFVALKPRPGDVAYTAAGRASMGRPPDFIGDHTAAVRVFAHLLALSLLP
jgi:fido (protein-threonine AMPylation protein)